MVDTLQAYSRGNSNAVGGGESSRADTLQAYGRGNSNVGGDEESIGASGAVDLGPPPAERISTGNWGTSGTNLNSLYRHKSASDTAARATGTAGAHCYPTDSRACVTRTAAQR